MSELIGAELDAAVARAQGWTLDKEHSAFWVVDGDDFFDCAMAAYYSPSTDWSQGGPIIEREKIAVYHQSWAEWVAGFDLGIDEWDYGGETGSGSSIELQHSASGHTALIAAMRAFVASKEK